MLCHVVLILVLLLPSAAWGQGLLQLPEAADGGGNDTHLGGAGQPVSAARLQELAQAWKLTAAEAEAIGEPWGAGKMRICISPAAPGVWCDVGSPKYGTFGGYQPVVFRTISRDVSWLSDAKSWYLSCLKWHDAFNALDARGANGSCMFTIGGIQAQESLVERGIRPSWSLERAGLMIMTTLTPDAQRGLWAPFSAFAWPVWVCIILTSVFVPLVLWVFEMAAAFLQLPTKKEQREARQLLAAEEQAAAAAASSKQPPDEEAAPEQQLGPTRPPLFSEDWYMLHFHTPKVQAVDLLLDYIRRSGLKMLRLVDPPMVDSLPSYAVLFGYGLLMTIIFALYTASAAAMLTTRSFLPAITGIQDLKGRAVGTWVDYVAPLAEEGITTVPFQWESYEDDEIMLQALASGFVQALVLDTVFVQYITSRRCNFVAVGQPFYFLDEGYAYNRRLAPELADDLDRYLQAAVQAGLIEEMARLYVTEGTGCSSAAMVDRSKGVSLDQVWGLWVVLAICIGFAGALNAFQWLRRRKLRRAQELAAQVVTRTAQSSVVAAKRLLRPKPRSGGSHAGEGLQLRAPSNSLSQQSGTAPTAAP